MALESGFLKRILRGPDAGSGSGGDQALEDREAVQKRSLRTKIDTLLSDESVEGSVRVAYEELRAALEGNSIKDSLSLVRGLLSEDDKPTFDSLGAEYHIARDPDPVRVEAAEAQRAAFDATPVIAANPVAPEEVRERASRGEQRLELTGEENNRINARVEMVLAAGSDKKKRERFEGLRGNMLAEHFDEVTRRLEGRGFVGNPPEVAAAPLEQPAQEAVVDSIPPVAEHVAPTLAESAVVGNETVDVGALEQELAIALRQESPEDRRERLTGVVRNYRLLMSNNEVRANEYLSNELARFSDDEARELQEIIRGSEGVFSLPPEVPAEVIGAEIASAAPEIVEAPTVSQKEIETAGIRSKAELDRKFGRSVASVGGERFWTLPNGNAVLFIPGEGGALQVAEGGVLKFRDTQDAAGPAYRYAGGAFTAMTPEEYAAYRQGVARASRRLPRTGEAEQGERQERARDEAVDRSVDVGPIKDAYTQYLRDTKKGMGEGRSFWGSADNLDEEDQLVLIRTLQDEALINRGLADTIINELGGERVRHAEEGATEARVEGRRVARTLEGAKAEFADLVGNQTDLQEAWDEIYPTLTRRNRLEFQTWLRSNPDLDQSRLDEVLGRGPRTAPREVAPAAVREATPRASREPETPEVRQARERVEFMRAIDEDLAKIRV